MSWLTELITAPLWVLFLASLAGMLTARAIVYVIRRLVR